MWVLEDGTTPTTACVDTPGVQTVAAATPLILGDVLLFVAFYLMRVLRKTLRRLVTLSP